MDGHDAFLERLTEELSRAIENPGVACAREEFVIVIPEWYAELLRVEIGDLPDGIFVPPLEVPIDERDLGIAAIGDFGI